MLIFPKKCSILLLDTGVFRQSSNLIPGDKNQGRGRFSSRVSKYLSERRLKTKRKRREDERDKEKEEEHEEEGDVLKRKMIQEEIKTKKKKRIYRKITARNPSRNG